jgi:uncharacterized Tic20 family protein/DNA-binding Xre family transcriptional regulator
MNQPDLGLKVSELRQNKGLTQEKLAEQCEVSPRTIQRIESGEADPRAYTLQCLSTALDFDFMQENTANENLWLAVLHLSSIVPMVIVALLVWSWKKNQSYKIDRQGRGVLNFQISMLLLLVLGGFLLLFMPSVFIYLGSTQVYNGPLGLAELMLLCATLPMVLLGLFSTYQGILNAARALADKPVRYALSIPFVR